VAAPLRDGAVGEVGVLAGLLTSLELRPVDLATAELECRPEPGSASAG
jgi:hypothetical protein